MLPYCMICIDDLSDRIVKVTRGRRSTAKNAQKIRLSAQSHLSAVIFRQLDACSSALDKKCQGMLCDVKFGKRVDWSQMTPATYEQVLREECGTVTVDVSSATADKSHSTNFVSESYTVSYTVCTIHLGVVSSTSVSNSTT